MDESVAPSRPKGSDPNTRKRSVHTSLKLRATGAYTPEGALCRKRSRPPAEWLGVFVLCVELLGSSEVESPAIGGPSTIGQRAQFQGARTAISAGLRTCHHMLHSSTLGGGESFPTTLGQISRVRESALEPTDDIRHVPVHCVLLRNGQPNIAEKCHYVKPQGLALKVGLRRRLGDQVCYTTVMNHHRVTHAFDSHRFELRHSTGLPALATNRLLGFAASTIIGIFFPIFLFEYFNQSLVPVLVWFGTMYALRAPLFIIAAKFFTRFSLVASMCVGTIAWLFYFLGPYIIERFPELPSSPFIAMSLVAAVVSASFYWGPFHVDFSKLTSRKKRGVQEGVVLSLQRLVAMFAPLFGGWVIMTYSYDAAFLIGLIIVLLSLIPLAFIPKNPVQYEYGFFQTFRLMFSEKYRYLSLSMMGYGAESSVGVVVWPIFLFIVFDGNHMSFGAFAAVIAVVGIMLQLFVGRYLDHHKK